MSNHGRTRIVGSLAIVLGVVVSFTIAGPAYAEEQQSKFTITSENYAQSLVVSSTAQTIVTIESYEIEVAPEPVVVISSSGAQTALPSFAGGSLLDAARSQIGAWQDCTALVENSLRMLGYSVGDLAPMGFGGYGVQVSPDAAMPGDIMMRGGHVAIYAGNNVAVHGGFNGSTVESSYGSSPYDFAVIIRVQ